MTRVLIAGLVAALAAGPAFAQAATAPAPAPAANGPLVPNVCLLSPQVAFANAKVGVAATARLRELAQQVQARLDATRAPLEAEAKALEAQRGKISAAEFSQRQQALTPRVQALQADTQNGNRQIDATRQAALSRIAREAQPIITAAYAAHHCGLLLDRASVLGGNMGNDLTPDVVQGLDARITTITFDLEPLPAAQPAAR
jgi:Skp family chaperone for outer membrane proteins